MPESLFEFVGIAFSPFSAPRRRPHQLVPPEDQVSFRILSVVEHRGSEGRLLISTVQPSPAALLPGLDLGTPIGSLSGGGALFRMIGEGDLPFQIRWLRNDHIIGMTGDLPVDRLVTLAHEVVVL